MHPASPRVDTKPEIEETCKPKCVKFKKEYDACVERVRGGHVHHEGANCTGQYFDFYQCVDACAAKPLFATLR